jgi:hypothetical protein
VVSVTQLFFCLNLIWKIENKNLKYHTISRTINDIPLGINSASRPILYAVDSSILIFGKNIHDLQIKPVTVLYSLSKWFTWLPLIKLR